MTSTSNSARCTAAIRGRNHGPGARGGRPGGQGRGDGRHRRAIGRRQIDTVRLWGYWSVRRAAKSALPACRPRSSANAVAPCCAATPSAMSTSSTTSCRNSRRQNVTMPQLIAGRETRRRQNSRHGTARLAGCRPAPATVRPLSGGEQQRVAIARAAADHPRIILADEPTGNLDPSTSDTVFSALAALIREEGAAALIATHNYDLARRANRIVASATA